MGTIELLKRDEGLRLRPYQCTAGKQTIGYGRNIEDNGIRESEAELMLLNDVDECKMVLSDRIENWAGLSEVRQGVLVNMMFNLGWPRLSKFKRMIAAVELGQFALASIEMLDSKWAGQVGARANRLSQMMKTNEWSK